jgi:FMN phosphatase YigB (HAD superfamily)
VFDPLRSEIVEEMAEAVSRAFSRGYDELRQQLRRPLGLEAESFRAILARIAAWQKGVLGAGFELKLWSRDSLLAIALEDAGVEVTGRRLAAASESYWRVLAERTRVHEDAAAIISDLRDRGVAVHLATNSDGFLRFDEGAQTFRYDPAWARARKLERLAAIWILGLSDRDVTVGDPIGKPNPAFYESALAEFAAKLGSGAIARECAIAVGDSLTSDVVPFLEAGVARGAWLMRTPVTLPASNVHPGVTVIGSLRELAALLD